LVGFTQIIRQKDFGFVADPRQTANVVSKGKSTPWAARTALIDFSTPC